MLVDEALAAVSALEVLTRAAPHGTRQAVCLHGCTVAACRVGTSQQGKPLIVWYVDDYATSRTMAFDTITSAALRADIEEKRADCKHIRTIEFVDDGQDFLRWEIAEDGTVISSAPLQSWVWCGLVITNMDTLRKGDYVIYRSREGRYGNIKHRVAKVTR